MSSEPGDKRPPRARREAARRDAGAPGPDQPDEALAAPADTDDGERQRTRAEEMGIPPLWAISGSGTKSKEQKRQLAAAEEALESAKKDARDANERYLRVAAEMENVQRRHRQDRQEQLLYGNAELIKRILPVLDNFHRALEHAPESVEGDDAVQQWISGLLMIVRQFEDILESMGVEPIEAVGQKFDPNFHQAVMAEPSDDHEDGEVIAELQRGYRLRDRVLRPSLVKVASNN
ncbi:MAG: molecular chaperone GrpE [Chloroflexota bacterium]|jgi:molecular chaperone GrpE|nr:molecular chaperone GrpE [Chloroflexota bacterium]